MFPSLVIKLNNGRRIPTPLSPRWFHRPRYGPNRKIIDLEAGALRSHDPAALVDASLIHRETAFLGWGLLSESALAMSDVGIRF